jgi:hypothetical protein
MSFIDSIKLIFIALQKGEQLGKAETWKNFQMAAALVATVLASVLAVFHKDLSPELLQDIGNAIAGIVAVVLYLIPATSKRVGLPGLDASDLVAPQAGGQAMGLSNGFVAGGSLSSVISSGAWSKLVTALKIVWYVVPKLNSLILLAEATFPGQHRGMEKLEFVRAKVMALYDRLGGTKLAFDAAWPAILEKINTIIASWNAKSAWPQLPAVVAPQ